MVKSKKSRAIIKDWQKRYAKSGGRFPELTEYEENNIIDFHLRRRRVNDRPNVSKANG